MFKALKRLAASLATQSDGGALADVGKDILQLVETNDVLTGRVKDLERRLTEEQKNGVEMAKLVLLYRRKLEGLDFGFPYEDLSVTLEVNGSEGEPLQSVSGMVTGVTVEEGEILLHAVETDRVYHSDNRISNPLRKELTRV